MPDPYKLANYSNINRESPAVNARLCMYIISIMMKHFPEKFPRMEAAKRRKLVKAAAIDILSDPESDIAGYFIHHDRILAEKKEREEKKNADEEKNAEEEKDPDEVALADASFAGDVVKRCQRLKLE